MRWLPFALLVLVTLTLQSTLAPRLAVLDARPDWILVLLMFYALFASPVEAAAGAWVVGLVADLMTIERTGLLALSYTLAVLLTCTIRDFLFRDQAITQMLLTLGVAAAVRFGWLVYRQLLYEPAATFWSEMATDVLWGALYTSLWAPLVHQGLWRVRGSLGIPVRRYTWAGLERLEGGTR